MNSTSTTFFQLYLSALCIYIQSLLSLSLEISYVGLTLLQHKKTGLHNLQNYAVLW